MRTLRDSGSATLLGVKASYVSLDTPSPASHSSRGNTYHLTHVNEALSGQEILLLGDYYLWFTIHMLPNDSFRQAAQCTTNKRHVALIGSVEEAMWI